MKRSIVFTTVVVLIALLCACGDGNDKGAKALLEEAGTLVAREAYPEALLLLDSLDRTYPLEVDARQQALAMRRAVRMAQSENDSVLFASQMQEISAFTDSLYKEFTLVEVPSMSDETTLRYKGYNPSAAQPQADFIDCYVAEDGKLELIVATSGTKTEGVEFVKVLETAGDTYIYSDTLVYDGGLNYRYQNLGRYYERLTYRGDRANKLAQFISNAPSNATVRITFGLAGGRLGRSFTLGDSARKAISESYLYTSNLEQLLELQKGLDKHSRRRQIEHERQMKEVLSNKE